MTVISKELFYERINEKITCDAVHFWEHNCFNSVIAPMMTVNVAKGSAKFFLPIYLLKLLINYKKINDTNFLKSLLVSEFRSTLYGIAMVTFLFPSICLLRKLCGRVHYYNLVFFPGFISGLSLLVETEENQILDTLIFFNSFVEAVLNNMDYLNIFKFTKTRETLVFMAVSASLMYMLDNRTKKIDYTYFWFYTPPKKKFDERNDNTCIHSDNCYYFSYKGFAKYFTLGYAVHIIRKLLPKMGVLRTKPLHIFKILFNKANVKFGLFIGGYVALYRIITCYLIRTGKIGRKFHGLIAGFCSGLTYAISPNIQVLVIGITTLLQVMYEIISSKLNVKNNFWPRQLLFMFCHGALLHNKFFYPKSCPTYYKNMIEACSNNVTTLIYDKLISTYFL